MLKSQNKFPWQKDIVVDKSQRYPLKKSSAKKVHTEIFFNLKSHALTTRQTLSCESIKTLIKMHTKIIKFNKNSVSACEPLSFMKNVKHQQQRLLKPALKTWDLDSNFLRNYMKVQKNVESALLCVQYVIQFFSIPNQLWECGSLVHCPHCSMTRF